jgi:hypothetical protein
MRLAFNKGKKPKTKTSFLYFLVKINSKITPPGADFFLDRAAFSVVKLAL